MGFLVRFQPGTETLCVVAELESEGQKGYLTSKDTLAQAAIPPCSDDALK